MRLRLFNPSALAVYSRISRFSLNERYSAGTSIYPGSRNYIGDPESVQNKAASAGIGDLSASFQCDPWDRCGVFRMGER